MPETRYPVIQRGDDTFAEQHARNTGPSTIRPGGGTAFQVQGRGGGKTLTAQDFMDPSGNIYWGNGAWIDSPTTRLARENAEFKRGAFMNVWGSLMGGQGPFTPGGSSGQGPEIAAGGAFSPRDIDRQVNAARASNDASSQSKLQAFRSDAAGRGVSPHSPLMQAMAGQLANQNLMANSTADREIRMGAKKDNADLVLKQQQAREGQFASRQDEDIRRRTPYFQMMGSLLGML